MDILGRSSRFFASHLLKVMMAYILQIYKIGRLEERPKTLTIMKFGFPMASETMRVRRRRDVQMIETQQGRGKKDRILWLCAVFRKTPRCHLSLF